MARRVFDIFMSDPFQINRLHSDRGWMAFLLTVWLDIGNSEQI